MCSNSALSLSLSLSLSLWYQAPYKIDARLCRAPRSRSRLAAANSESKAPNQAFIINTALRG
jgi:hypothetical protein